MGYAFYIYILGSAAKCNVYILKQRVVYDQLFRWHYGTDRKGEMDYELVR